MSLTENISIPPHDLTGDHEIVVDTQIRLKKIILEDSPAIFGLVDRNRPHLSQFGDKTADNYPTVESVEQRNRTQSDGEHRYGIWDNDQFVGFVKITQKPEQTMEIGYWLGSEYQGKGYMTKAVTALTSHALARLGAKAVFGAVVKGNDTSSKVLERSGYVLVGDNPEDLSEQIWQFKPNSLN